MKRLKYIALIIAFGTLTACSNWLEILPQNMQPSKEYWNSKESVESVLGAGYVKLRENVYSLIDWGELRGGVLYATKGDAATKLQNFRITPDDKSVCNWRGLYEIINMANSVLLYGPGVLEKDETLNENQLNSFLTEAYFLRALSYFYLVRNWRDVPLILTPYVNDDTDYSIAKSPASVVLAQIKTDITTALESGAAKESFDDISFTKGRATRWALNALMADVCLWTENYKEAEDYCNAILNGSGSGFIPVFVEDGTRWFEMFYPGNSNEAIFEIQWNRTTHNQTNKLTSLFGYNNPTYEIQAVALEPLQEDFLASTGDNHRGKFGTYVTAAGPNVEESDFGYVWKYNGIGLLDDFTNRTSNENDGNFIIYRVAEIMLMKAEALIMTGPDRWEEALALVNRIRTRAGVPEHVVNDWGGVNEETMLRYVLDERKLELTAEGKRWYDVLRFGKMSNYKYRQQFLIDEVTAPWSGTTKSWITSVLTDDNALYLPIWQTEIETNKLLEQNPYYQ